MYISLIFCNSLFHLFLLFFMSFFLLLLPLICSCLSFSGFSLITFFNFKFIDSYCFPLSILNSVVLQCFFDSTVNFMYLVHHYLHQFLRSAFLQSEFSPEDVSSITVLISNTLCSFTGVNS